MWFSPLANPFGAPLIHIKVRTESENRNVNFRGENINDELPTTISLLEFSILFNFNPDINKHEGIFEHRTFYLLNSQTHNMQ